MQDIYDVRISATWTSQNHFTGKSSSGAAVHMDGLNAPDATSPMQLLLLALAGCTGMDIVSILQKKKKTPDQFEIIVHGKRADELPRIWKQILIIYNLTGSNIKEKDVETAIELSKTKYCSVGAMLGKSAIINYEYHIFPSKGT